MILTIKPKGEPAIPVGEVPNGDASIDRTVAVMRRVVADAVQSPIVRGVARQITATSGGAQYPYGVDAFLRDGMTYQDDPPGEERLITPESLIDAIDVDGKARGDCDDVAMLGASLLYVAGYRPVFIVVGRAPKTIGGRLEHVYFGYLRNIRGPLVPANVFPLDPQERMRPGAWPDAYARSRIYRVFA